MKVPLLQDKKFLKDVKYSQERKNHFDVWWMGQSGFLIRWQSKFLLLDPYLSDTLTEKYAATDKPHVRMTERVVAPEQLDFISLATSSHNHTDHLDAGTLVPLMEKNPDMKIIIPEANRPFAADRLGCSPDALIGLTDGRSASVEGFLITAIPAAHNDLETDDEGHNKYLGYIVQLGDWTLYHSGDTLWYEGLEDRLKAWDIHVAFLPINGNKPERRVAGNLDGREAATLAREIGADMVIPCHYDMFTFNTESPDLFIEEAERLGQPYAVLENGQRWSSRALKG